MARGELILRQWNLLRLLQTRGEGVPLREIADALNVSERTVQRDFEALQEIGFPLEFEEDDCGRRFWRMPAGFFRSGPLVLGITEAISLHLAERMLEPLAGTLFVDGLNRVLDKIRTLMPTAALNYFARLESMVFVRHLGATDHAAHADTIRVITEAIRQELTILVGYKSFWRGAEYETLFDPYGLVYFDGEMFVLGNSHRASGLRILKIARVSSAKATHRRFERPADFDLGEHFRASFGIVHVAGEPVSVVARFTGSAAALVGERAWHESQQVAWLEADATLFEDAPEGAEEIVASFRLSSTIEFKRWIKGFGAEAEVLQPGWLRDELRAELQSAAARYATP